MIHFLEILGLLCGQIGVVQFAYWTGYRSGLRDANTDFQAGINAREHIYRDRSPNRWN